MAKWRKMKWKCTSLLRLCFSSESSSLPRNCSHTAWLAVTCVFTPMAHKPQRQSITPSDKKEFSPSGCSEINVDWRLFMSHVENRVLLYSFQQTDPRSLHQFYYNPPGSHSGGPLMSIYSALVLQ